MDLFYQNWLKLTSTMTSNDVKMKKNIGDFNWTLETIKLAIKPIESGIVAIYSSTTSDFRRFLSKLAKIDV